MSFKWVAACFSIQPGLDKRVCLSRARRAEPSPLRALHRDSQTKLAELEGLKALTEALDTREFTLWTEESYSGPNCRKGGGLRRVEEGSMDIY